LIYYVYILRASRIFSLVCLSYRFAQMFHFTVFQNVLFPVVPAARHKDCDETTAYGNLMVKSCGERSFGKPFKGGLHSDGALRKEILSVGG